MKTRMRYVTGQMKMPCYQCAEENGKTVAEADECFEGSCGCKGCPFVRASVPPSAPPAAEKVA